MLFNYTEIYIVNLDKRETDNRYAIIFCLVCRFDFYLRNDESNKSVVEKKKSDASDILFVSIQILKIMGDKKINF